MSSSPQRTTSRGLSPDLTTHGEHLGESSDTAESLLPHLHKGENASAHLVLVLRTERHARRLLPPVLHQSFGVSYDYDGDCQFYFKDSIKTAVLEHFVYNTPSNPP